MDLSRVNDPYVVGFLFDRVGPGAHVMLIRKQRPEWQRGRLNGVGGSVKPGEEPLAAMRRECREEAGCDPTDWEHFATLRSAWPAPGPAIITPVRLRYAVLCYRSFDRMAYKNARTMTDEIITCVPAIHHMDSVDTLDYLIPLAMDRHLVIPIELVRP